MNIVAPDHASEGIHPGENTEPSTAANEKKSDWKTTASATANLVLRGVRDSADAFGLLKSVAGGLCFILENCEVRSSLTSPVAALTCIPAHEGKRGNDRVVGTRVRALSELLCRPVSDGDPKEQERRKKLEQ